MDTAVHEALLKVTPLTQPTAASMELKTAVQRLAEQLDAVLTRLNALEAAAPVSRE